MNRFVPLSIPNFEGNEREYVDKAIDEGWVSTGGACIDQFEQMLEDFLCTENIAACQSGTSALHLSLIEAGVRQDDVVLVSPLTFIAAVNPIKYLLAKPVFIDCDDSLCIDPEKLRRFCEEQCVFSEGKLTYQKHIVRAVIVIHVFGNLADMEQIMEVANRFGLKVIEDATEALGSKFLKGKYAGKYAGTIGDFGAFSFNGNKIITTGGGGAVTARKAETIDHIRYLSTQAKDDPYYYIHNEVGYNYRMTNIQAALGVAQMEELPFFIERKRKNYNKYRELFKDFPLGTMLAFRKDTFSNMWFYSLEIERDKIKAPMKEIITRLADRGVQTRAIWGLINEQKPYLQEDSFQIEKASFYAERILNLPCSTQITEEEILYTVDQIKDVLEQLKE